MPRFEFKEGTSSKFWEITQDDNVITTRWGRIGAEGQEKTQEFGHQYDARRAYRKFVEEKEKKGYTRVKPTDSGPGPLSNPELEEVILRTPESLDGYLVYGDWLQAQGDPRGELIALQHALLQAKGAEATALKRKVTLHLKKHQDVLLGERLGSMLGELTLKLEWHLGFIRSARLGVANDDDDLDFGMDETLSMLLAHPSARFLQELTLGPTTDGEVHDYEDLIERLVKAAPASLRKLFIGDFDFGPDEWEFSWGNLGDLSSLYAALPGLRSLRLRGQAEKLGKMDLPELREFTLESTSLPRDEVKAIAAAKWPKLERLELWFGAEDEGAVADVKYLQPILDGTGLPELKHLGLCNAEFTNALCEALPKSKVLKQLETLDLSRGTMNDEGAERLLKHAEAFQHLKRLDVTQNLLGDKAAKSLAKLCPDVARGQQRDPDEEEGVAYRYESSGE
ncbi:WGR domain-containing protein [Pyxidicoccus fallax]|uniref:WGR domain-containing protein n=1 Tax=Pyxidicoccus fallax TaxID=394095 RepID=A0A848LV55_9BACT|nr:WGR domain-containing protein [Pyxidicoccus fallax]NMO21885.1 WGR domain-containing protein [Pyxidicoccus fallax]NPC83495.1 WGR domain-containing protein [Pyxidicoccus fallax]